MNMFTGTCLCRAAGGELSARATGRRSGKVKTRFGPKDADTETGNSSAETIVELCGKRMVKPACSYEHQEKDCHGNSARGQ